MPSKKPSGEISAAGGNDEEGGSSGGEGDRPAVRTARHAARRRTLLQRLHMPVGKAVALAAMPSAVLLGTGFTSPLAAKADQQPQNPFQGSSCVEMPDQPPPETEESAGPERPGRAEETQQSEGSVNPAPEADEAPAVDGGAADGTAEEPAAAESEAPAQQDATGTDGNVTGEETGETGDATETGETAETGDTGVLGGLGDGLEEIGDGLEDLFTPGDDGSTEPAEPEEPEDSPAPEEPTQPDAPAPEETAPEGPEDAGEDAADEQASGPSPSAQAPSAPGQDATDGRQPFPCPEERQVPGVDEQTPVVLPDNPWYLDASSLTLYGLDYHGVVNVATADGSSKQVLKFTAEQIDIGDLHQIVDGQGGVRRHVATQPGSVSTFRNGTVTMYTERLEGNLFGVVPVVFDPEHQPPLDLPIANFTDVLVTQAGQFGGELTMRGMNSYITHDGPTRVQ